MKLSELKNQLNALKSIRFQLPNRTFVPEHFHVTEMGLLEKKFIDCGGTVRNETWLSFQLWNANDFEHRLKPKTLLEIIALSEKVLGIEDAAIEVEYQNSTIGRYDLEFNGQNFELINKQTACLATDNCGIPSEKQKIRLAEKSNATCCAPNGNCC